MAAYGAAISLKNTIQSILESSRISLVPPSHQIIQQAYVAVWGLQKALLKLDHTGYSKIRTKVNALDERIKEVVWEFEDLLETCFTDQILPQLDSSGGKRDHLSFSVDLQSLQHSVDRFVYKVRAMEMAYDIELVYMPEEEGEPISSRIDFGRINSNMVGLSGEFEQVRDYLLAENGRFISVVGMAGVGKTTLAKKIFDDPSIQRHFKLRAWVKVGRKCGSNESLRCILAQVDPNTHDLNGDDDDDDEKLVGVLEEILNDNKCLIVLDDVWEWDMRLMDNLPQDNVRILLTSRQNFGQCIYQKIGLLDGEESKKLLGEKVFGEKSFPPHLEKLGEIIAYKCEGLPLMIVTIAELLSKEEKTLEYWTEVAQKQHNSVFVDAYNQISEVLFPSYDYLPQNLKMIFLYMGAFPPYKNIIMLKLFCRLRAEGFLEQNGKLTLEDFMYECSAKLNKWYHLVLHKYNGESWFSTSEFRVHSCWQHLCKKEASKIKFLHVLQSCDDVMKDQRRLCAHCNTLFAFKQVYGSIKSDCASTARSLLCYGPYHKYPMPIHAMDFKLLRVLDAVDIRFYHIPLEILKLVCLHYLALTCNEELPASISNLFHLQSLIIGRYMSINKRGNQSYIPVEIWDMQELQHIEIYGRNLPIPNSNASLDKLSDLIDVSAKSCNREILKRIPNLNRLEIVMELKPYDDDNDDDSNLSHLCCISEELQSLDVLACIVVNPEMKYASIMVPLSMFSSSLTILCLSGLGCPWKHMNDIGSLLPNLTDLKLIQYAFQGPEWDIDTGSFMKLDTLVIVDSDLVRWRPQHGSLPRLELLSIRHCYKLQQLECWTPDPSMVKTPTIELVECNPSGFLYSARQLLQNSHFIVRFSFSFWD